MTDRNHLIEAVIFDLDGTLIDTENLSDKCMDAMIQPFGASMSWDIKKLILGTRSSEWSHIVLDKAGISHDHLSPEQLVQGWERLMADSYHSVATMPGAQDLVAHLQACPTVRLALATSSSRAAVEKKRIPHPKLFGAFEVVVTGDDAEVAEGKPAPDIFLVAARRLGVRPEACLVFEDSLFGCQAGLAAGMHVVAVPDPRLETHSFPDVHIVSSLDAFDPTHCNFLPARRRA